jgi:hypothetical protein
MSALPAPDLAFTYTAPRPTLAARIGDEWHIAQWPARVSVIVLLLFYLFADEDR